MTKGLPWQYRWRHRLMSDEAKAFMAIGENYAKRDTVKHSSREYFRDAVHVNSVEGFNSRVRRTIAGVFHHISPQHADLYFHEIGERSRRKERCPEAVGLDHAEETELEAEDMDLHQANYEIGHRQEQGRETPQQALPEPFRKEPGLVGNRHRQQQRDEETRRREEPRDTRLRAATN
ncbi:hypothetical protein ABIA24_006657 [Sinorhizobium fredii]|nr:hypothetical protein EFR01_59230 [Sinorhizobium fredii]GLS06823.1 hypothetical protein GCM10007864_04480 [Sinorhizobium fredii]